jgi:hypothetical protein
MLIALERYWEILKVTEGQWKMWSVDDNSRKIQVVGGGLSNWMVLEDTED